MVVTSGGSCVLWASRRAKPGSGVQTFWSPGGVIFPFVAMPKRGIVFVDVEWHRRNRLGFAIVPGEPPVRAFWEPDDPEDPTNEGEWRDFEDPEAAIAWGRNRAPIVLVRIGSSEDDVYSAGDRVATRELPEYGGTDLRPYPPWPPSDRS